MFFCQDRSLVGSFCPSCISAFTRSWRSIFTELECPLSEGGPRTPAEGTSGFCFRGSWRRLISRPPSCYLPTPALGIARHDGDREVWEAAGGLGEEEQPDRQPPGLPLHPAILDCVLERPGSWKLGRKWSRKRLDLLLMFEEPPSSRCRDS